MLFLSGATSREVLLLARTVFAILHVLRTNISRTDLIRFRAPFARLDVVLRKTRAASIVSSLFRGAAHRFRWLGNSACAGPARVPAFLAERGLISASRGASASSCHRCASSLGEEVVGASFTILRLFGPSQRVGRDLRVAAHRPTRLSPRVRVARVAWIFN